MIERIDFKEKSFAGSVGGEDFDYDDWHHSREHSNLQNIFSSYQGGSARTSGGQRLNPMDTEV
jgi:hypothetical protein